MANYAYRCNFCGATPLSHKDGGRKPETWAKSSGLRLT